MTGTTSREFVDAIIDILEPLAPLGSGRFFGGHALKSGGRQFAMIMDGALYLRADEALAAVLAELGSEPFSYGTAKGRVTVSSYYAVPEDRLDDVDAVLGWARQAIAAAGSARRKPQRGRAARRP